MSLALKDQPKDHRADGASAAIRSAPTGGARPLVICQVLHSLHVGGAEVLALRLAQRLKDRYRLVFACLDELGEIGRQLEQEGFPVEVLGRRPGLDRQCIARLGAFVRRHQADVIHAHQYTPFFYSLASRVFRSRPPVLLTEHGRHFPDYRRLKRVIFNRLLLRSRDHVIGVGEAVRRALVINEGIPQRRTGVIYNGIDLSTFTAGGHDRLAIRREAGLGAEDFVVVHVARFDPVKDHLTALRAIERVAAHVPRARLVILGDGSERPRIEAEMSARNLTDSVRLLGMRRDVARWYAAADAFLLSSVTEGIPLTVIEAMASGLPVVATDVGGVAEVVDAPTTGLLAPAGDDRELACHLLQLAADPALRQMMGAAGKTRALNLFDERQMHAQYCELFEEMVRG